MRKIIAALVAALLVSSQGAMPALAQAYCDSPFASRHDARIFGGGATASDVGASYRARKDGRRDFTAVSMSQPPIQTGGGFASALEVLTAAAGVAATVRAAENASRGTPSGNYGSVSQTGARSSGPTCRSREIGCGSPDRCVGDPYFSLLLCNN